MLLRFLAPSLLVAPVLAQASFQGIGLPFSRASGISSDGRWVVGSEPGGTFRWNATSGAQVVVASPLEGGDVEASQGALFGCGAYIDPATNADEAARWDVAGNVQFVGSLSPNAGSMAYGIDDAGATIVGSATYVSTTGTTWHAFRWTMASGLVDLGTSAGLLSRANGISGDGNVAVGYCNGFPRQPARWVGTTLTPLASAGTTAGEAWAANADGSVITGVYGDELFRWTQAAGMQLLGKLPGSTANDTATGLDISADGSVIVGSQTSFSMPTRAFLWRASTGMVDLAPYLAGLGATQVAGWNLWSAVGVSADGTRIAGWGTTPVGSLDSWIATIPPEDALATYCTPGLAGVSACPCANPPSGAGRGCDNSASTGGAALAGSGSASLANDTCAIAITGLVPTSTTVLLQGTNATSGASFGQGVLCIGGSLKRLYLRSAVAGSLSLPQSGDASLSARSAALGDTLAAGATRQYQAWYRDPIVLGGCAASATWNTSDAGTLTWNP